MGMGMGMGRTIVTGEQGDVRCIELYRIFDYSSIYLLGPK